MANISVVGIADKKTQQVLLSIIEKVAVLERKYEELRARNEKLERKR